MNKSLATRIALSLAAPVAAIALLSGCSSDSSAGTYCVDDQHRLQENNDQCNAETHGYVFVISRTQYTYDPSKALVIPEDKNNTFVSPSDENARANAGISKVGPVEEPAGVHSAPEPVEPHISEPHISLRG